MTEIWKRFDQRLFALKLMEPSLQMQEDTKTSEKKIRFENSRSGQGPSSFYVEQIDGAIAVLRKYLENVDRVCREVWQMQGNSITADFARAIRDEAIWSTIEVRAAAIKESIERMAARTGFAELMPIRHHLVQVVDHLKSVMGNRYETEARELEYKNAAPAESRSVDLGGEIAQGVSGEFLHEVKLPDGLQSTGDPIEGNPFPLDDPRHAVWRKASLSAEEELCRLNSEFLAKRPTGTGGFAAWMKAGWASAREDFDTWTLDLWVKKFDIWAKRYIQTVWSEEAVRGYDQWLFNYGQACLTAQGSHTASTDGLLLELRLRLIERMEWWKAEGRRYLTEQKAHLASAAKENTRRKSSKASKTDPEVAKRRSLVKSNPDLPSQDMCDLFDRQHVPLPPRWEQAGLRSWSASYRKPEYRRRIHVLTSKDGQHI